MCNVPFVETPRNPYRPGAAVQPSFLAGRDELMAEFLTVLRDAPEIPGNVRMTGLRGVGKSVLLARCDELAQEAGWAVERVELEPRHNTESGVTGLIEALTDRLVRQLSMRAQVADIAARAVRTVRWQVAVDEVTFSLDPTAGHGSRSIVESLHRAVHEAQAHGRSGLVLMLDEAQVVFDDRRQREAGRSSQYPLSALIAAVSALQSRGAPLVLVLCGLPTLQANLLRARTYTERMFRGLVVDRLGDAQATEAFVRPLDGSGVRADEALVGDVVASVDGYPYFLQLWGAELWDAIVPGGGRTLTLGVLAAIRERIIRRLDRDFFEGRFAVLRPSEQDLLLASASCPYPPLRVADLREHTDKRPGYVNVLIGRLTEAGVLYTTGKGLYHNTAPLFHEYLQRRARMVADMSGRSGFDRTDGTS